MAQDQPIPFGIMFPPIVLTVPGRLPETARSSIKPVVSTDVKLGCTVLTL
jgi:hypothetical protein